MKTTRATATATETATIKWMACIRAALCLSPLLPLVAIVVG